MGQRIEALEGDRRWIPFLRESGALAPRSEAVRLLGPGSELGDSLRTGREVGRAGGNAKSQPRGGREQPGGRLELGDAGKEATPGSGRRRLERARWWRLQWQCLVGPGATPGRGQRRRERGRDLRERKMPVVRETHPASGPEGLAHLGQRMGAGESPARLRPRAGSLQGAI